MNKYLTPIAIVIVGVLVAGAIYFTKKIETNNPAIVSQTQKEVAVTPINENDHILGNPQANIVIVEYGDLECPPCKMFHTVMHQVMDNYAKSGQVAWVFRHAPIAGLHPKAPNEAEATECAAIQ